MRCRSRHSRIVLGHRPFEGELGASLYVGTNGQQSIRYRRHLVYSAYSAPFVLSSFDVVDPGAESIPKSQAVAQVTGKTEIGYELPESLLGTDLWCQVRTFESDHENDSIYRPRPISIDDAGADASVIAGAANVNLIEKRDGGLVRIGWIWQRVKTGLQPTSFLLRKVSGPGTVPDTDTSAGSGRLYSVDIAGLLDGGSYVFALIAATDVVETVLVPSISFTADSSGPPPVSDLIAVPV